jgi:hypothetical protein
MIPRQTRNDSPGDLRIDPDLSAAERCRAAAGRRRLQRFSGVARRIYRHIDRQAIAIANRPLRVLVVPTPNVEIPLSWAKRSRASRCEIELTLVDVPHSEFVRSHIDAAIADGYSINCVDVDCLHHPIPVGFDMVISIYLMHSLRSDEAFRQLQSMIGSTAGPLIVCDIARSHTNAWLAKLASRAVSRNPAVHELAEQHIRSAYSVDEFRRIAQSALARPVEVHSLFPCHFIMVCQEQTNSDPVPAFA